MKALGLWPEMERALPFGHRYEHVNAVLVELARTLGIDLWTLDSLWWRVDLTKEEQLEIATPKSATSVEAPDEPVAAQRFGLEKHLQEFLRDNWDKTALGRDWKLYEEDGDPEAGYEYPCDVGRIDLLARHRAENRWLVIELKRNQSSDQTVGQVLRYMGWVGRNLAKPGEPVEGLVIAADADTSLRYALDVAPTVSLKLYEVEFRLKESADIGPPRSNAK
jgi:RecB family endonuclease NucS